MAQTVGGGGEEGIRTATMLEGSAEVQKISFSIRSVAGHRDIPAPDWPTHQQLYRTDCIVAFFLTVWNWRRTIMNAGER
jgi:hypothetical protein